MLKPILTPEELRGLLSAAEEEASAETAAIEELSRSESEAAVSLQTISAEFSALESNLSRMDRFGRKKSRSGRWFSS